MKKYLTFMAFAMTAVFGLVSISCSEDDDEIGGSSSSVPAGALVGDDAEANAAVADLRLAAVSDNYTSYHYTYDEKGNLETISRFGYWSASAKDNFKITESGADDGDQWEAVYTFNMSNNRVNSYSYREDGTEYDGEHYTGTETWNFKYNAKGQLSSVELICNASGSDWNEKGKALITITYDPDGRITLVDDAEEWDEDGEKETYQETRTFEYDSSSKVNKFYQYTQRLFSDALADMDEGVSEAFAYVGLFGRASAYIPTKSTYKSINHYDGKDHTYSGTSTDYACSFNNDGTLRSAVYYGDEYYNFTYTTVGTRSVFETGLPVWRQDERAKDKRVSHRSMIKSKRERRRQNF